VHAVRVLSGIALVLWLSGCAVSKPASTPPLSIEARTSALSALTAFRVKGGLGIWTDEQSISSRIDWRQQANDFDVQVTAPLGLSRLRLWRQDGQASLQRGDAAPVRGQSADRLLQSALGLQVPVPVAQLGRWIRGLPGDAEAVRYDDAGRMESLDYIDAAGTRWRARVRKHTQLDALEVPSLITAKGGPYNIRLVLKQWQREEAALASDADTPTPAPGRLRIPGQ